MPNLLIRLQTDWSCVALRIDHRSNKCEKGKQFVKQRLTGTTNFALHTHFIPLIAKVIVVIVIAYILSKRQNMCLKCGQRVPMVNNILQYVWPHFEDRGVTFFVSAIMKNAIIPPVLDPCVNLQCKSHWPTYEAHHALSTQHDCPQVSLCHSRHTGCEN